MNETDLLHFFIGMALSAGQTPKDAIETAAETIRLLHVDMYEASNDEA